MELYPAIDIRDGHAVRLTQGDFSRETGYGDPLELARRYIDGGARWIHVVDLDAARSGTPVNRAAVLAITSFAADVGVWIQTGGGVRTESDVDALLGGGVRRVVFGTSALTDPVWCREVAAQHPGQVAVGLDYRTGADGRGEVAIRGWEEGAGSTVGDVLGGLEGADVDAVIVTAIERDGTLEGPDLGGLSAVLDQTTLPVVASGGVGRLEDLVELSALRLPGGRELSGVIVGKALVDGRIGLEEAIAACAPSE